MLRVPVAPFFSLIILATITSILIVSAKQADDCYATTSTTVPNSYTRLFSTSSTTNGTVSLKYDVSNYPVHFLCQLGTASLALRSTTTGCLPSEFSLFNISTTTTIVNDVTNEHIESPTLGNYPNVFCVLPDSLVVSSSTATNRSGNCSSDETAVFSAPSVFTTTGNTHAGSPASYTLKRCLTLPRTQALSVSISSSSVSFGALSAATTTYATSDGKGTTTPFIDSQSGSFSVQVDVSGNYNYVVYLSGDTLRNQQNGSIIIPKIGGVPASFIAGTEQFGLNATVYCGVSCSSPTSTIAYPYNSAQFAYDGGASSTTILANGVSDDSTIVTSYFNRQSTYYLRLGATISTVTPVGNYNTSLIVTVTPEF
jgi:hypothetical protein